MPRFSRNSIINTPYFHVITQGINKSYIFQKSEDIKYYIKQMYLLTKEQNISIISYCIMNNHTHMLLKTENIEELSKYMQRLNTRYSKYYNKKNERVGYVFRNRYKSEGIYNENHLYNCIKYIYNNPVKAGICSKPENYPYSNYKKLNKKIEGHYTFIEADEDNENNEDLIKNTIKNFLIENEVDLEKLKKNKTIIKKFVVTLKDDYNISLRNIAKSLNMSREKIRKIYSNK